MNGNNVNSKVDSIETVNILNSARNFFFIVTIVAMALNLAILVLASIDRVDFQETDMLADCNMTSSSCGLEKLPAPEENAPAQVKEQEALNQTETEPETPVAVKEVVHDNEDILQDVDVDIINKSAEDAIEDASASSEIIEETQKKESWKIDSVWAGAVVKLCNAVVMLGLSIIAGICVLTTCISIGANLGGLASITQAMLLSWVAIIFFLPWQIPFGELYIAGAMYLPVDLERFGVMFDSSIADIIWMSLRFFGLWLLVAILMITSHVKASCWKKRVSKRIGLISE